MEGCAVCTTRSNSLLETSMLCVFAKQMLAGKGIGQHDTNKKKC
jgi:hypothetical protein